MKKSKIFPSFEISDKDAAITHRIAVRACKMAIEIGIKNIDVLTTDMDITATHANGNPLRLSDLLKADNSNFLHDVFGIRRHLNRYTGELQDCFVPRYSA